MASRERRVQAYPAGQPVIGPLKTAGQVVNPAPALNPGRHESISRAVSESWPISLAARNPGIKEQLFLLGRSISSP